MTEEVFELKDRFCSIKIDVKVTWYVTVLDYYVRSLLLFITRQEKKMTQRILKIENYEK